MCGEILLLQTSPHGHTPSTLDQRQPKPAQEPALVGGGLTCNIDLSSSFYYLFFSFVLLELKPFVLKGKVLGEKC